MAQTKTYFYCNYSIMSGITVTLTSGASYHMSSAFLQCTLENDIRPMTWSIPLPLPVDLRVYWSYYNRTVENGIVIYDGVVNLSSVILSGTTSISYDTVEYGELHCINPEFLQEITGNSYTLLDQQSLPSGCTAQPSGCTVTSLGTVVTAPTQRGQADGQIQFSVTGNTGTTLIWKINGVSTFTGNTPYTFTGLTAGLYTVIAYENFCYAQEVSVTMPDGQFFTNPFLTGSPAQLTAANNPIVFELQTAINNPNPQPAKSRFFIANNVGIDTTITFNISYPQVYQAVFIAKGYPDRNTYFLASGLTDSTGVLVGYNSDAEIATSLAEVIQQDVVLSRLYYITNDGAYVSLVARENTPNLNLTTAQVTISQASIQLITDQLGVGHYEGQLTGDYSLYAEVYVNPDLQFGDTPVEANFVRVAELQLPFQQDNIHRFQLDTVLKNYCSTFKPDFTISGFTTFPDYDCAYFVKYGEIFPLIANSQTKKKRFKGKSGFLVACNAALDFEQPNDMTAYLGIELTGLTGTTGFTFNYPRSGVTWLTNSPQTLYVQRDSKQYLSFLLKRYYASSGRTLSCRGDVYFYNGTSSTGLTFFNITSGTTTNFGGMTLLAVGYNELGLAALESSGNTKVRRVDFAVYNQDINGLIPLTTVKTFLYEIDEAPTRFGTAFLNKLGAWDIFDWVGEVVSDENITREQYQLPREILKDGSSPMGFIANSVYNTQYTKKHVVNSGTIDSATYEWLQELLQSNRIYSYTEAHQNFLTVESQIANKSTNTNEFTIQVTFVETIFENSVSV